ncbi:N-acetyltransferase 9 [Dimargaris xerosporica]|nr:N-acetyltransferase 9 [Dimargaris xerosporica]
MQVGPEVFLVPYSAEHVPAYHEWMKNPYLQEMTASEPLTLEEEYDMQRQWRKDDDKCTFIVIARSDPTRGFVRDSDTMMIGDVNLFFNDPDDLGTCEIEAMIAETPYRGRGLGTQAIRMMMYYAITTLKVHKFTAKILEHNEASRALFANKLGFHQVRYTPVFHQYEYELPVTDKLHEWAREFGQMIDTSQYQ